MFLNPRAPVQNSFRNLPAPRGGFTTSQLLMGMKPDYAVILENLFPLEDGVETRDGYVSHITAIPLQADRLHVYSGPTGVETLWGTTAGGVYNFTTAGACPAASIALTNGKTISTAISTGAGSYMLLANGTDTIKQFDGTTWTSIATFGATATSVYNYLETYRQRIFLVKKNSLEIEYLAANSIAGAATNYPLGALFRLGGYIVAMSVWTVDGGVGPEDNLCVMTNKGEVAVFAGNDPAYWELRGVYFAGRPLGETPMYKYGGDVLLITESGIIAMTQLIQTASIDRQKIISQEIRQYLISQATSAFSGQGWQLINDPFKPFLLLNMPTTPVRMQSVMNSQTQAWTTYTGWNALYFARKAGELYFSDSGGSAGAWTVRRINGASDLGTNITATMLQAYNAFSFGGEKQIQEVKPYFEAASSFNYNAGVASDFATAKEFTNQSVNTGATAALWGTSLWGTALWTGQDQITNDWITVPDIYSVWKGFYIQIVTRLAVVKYLGADLLLKKGGNF